MQVFGFPPWLRLWVAGPTSVKGGSFCIFFDGTSPLMYMFMLLLFSRSVVSDSLRPMDCSTQASLSFTVSWSLFVLMSIESVMLSSHHILCCPLLLLSSILASIRTTNFFFSAARLFFFFFKKTFVGCGPFQLRPSLN